MALTRQVKTYLRVSASGILGCLTLAACSQTQVGQTQRAVEGSARDTSRYLDQAHSPLKPADISPVQIREGSWGTATATRSDHGTPLPYRFEATAVHASSSSPVTIYQAGSLITAATGIPVTFDPDVREVSGSSSASSGAAKSGGPRSALQGAIRSAGVAETSVTTEDGSFHESLGDTSKMTLPTTAQPLSRLLANVCGYFGVSWSYDGNRIRIFRHVTRTYHIRALPIDALSMSTAMNAGSTSSGASSGGKSSQASKGTSTQSSTSQISIKIWDDIEAGIKALLAGRGTMSSSHSTGTITITAPAPVVDTVQSFIDKQNRILGQQVAVSVQLLSLQLTDSDEINFDLDGIIKKAGKYGLDVGTGAASSTASSAASGAEAAFTLSKSSSSLNGSTAVANLLSELGRVRVVTRASVLTLNGMPAPLGVSHTQGYLAQVQTTLAAITTSGTSNGQTTLTQGSVTYGFNMNILPQVMDGGANVLLQFSMSLSDLDGKTNGFDEISSGNETIQLPNIISRNFSQEAEVPNGGTLVLTGFEQTDDISNKSGTGSPNNILLGGSQTGSHSRTMIVVLMTPVVQSKQMISYE